VITVPEYSGWKWIDAETQIKILDALPSSDRPIFVFLFLHGCRPGEARALKVKDVDLASKTIRIRRTFSLNQLRETTKQKRQNIIPAHPELMPYIEDVLKSSLPEAFLFVNQRTGKPYNDETLRKIWHRALKKADLQNSGLRLYDASRHSFASQLINANVPLNIVSRLLGHSSLKMTQRYAHESADSMKLAMRNLTLSTVPKLSLKEKDAKK
jgi:integrase